MSDVDALNARIDALRAQLAAIANGDALKAKASGIRIGSVKLQEAIAGVLQTSGLLRVHYGSAAERAASTDYHEGVLWWESDNDILYAGTGAAWQMVGGAGGAPPGVHHATHENAGADEISVAGLSGLLADGQTPLAHKDSHDPQDGSDKLDTAAASEIAGVQAAGAGSAHTFARADHAHQIQHGIADNHLVTVDDADAAANDIAQFTASGLQGLSYAELLVALSGQASADFAMNTHKITGVVDPGADQDVATKKYVDDNIGGGGVAVMDDLDDADTTTDPPAKNEVLKWNGSNWVPAVYNATFTFSIASFSDGEATTQLIGSGVWAADETLSFSATYNNGPPISADVLMSINGAAYNEVGHMDAAPYTSGTNYEGDINYPAAKDYYLRFRLDATDGEDADIEYETAIYFRNYIYWGVIAKADTFTEADIEGLAGSAITNTINVSKSINAGAGEYIVYAYPTSYTAMDEGDDYEDDGGTDFLFNGIACAMIRDNANLSITNSAGFTEGYDVYVSKLANLGNHTFVANTTDQTIDPLYYGITEKEDTFLEADIEGLTNHPNTNDNTQVWTAVTTGVGEYMLFAFPKRLGIPTFWVGGFEGGFEAPETVSVTNANGWTEDYYAWRSSNSNLGSTVVETK
jgi:hypothetical protein